jgi:flavin reductase (DIM6/NTAB) family NADH-FMN oxidoreductase RutF
MLSELPPFVFTKEFKYTASPNPGWTYGQGIETTPEGRAWAEGEKAGWKVIDASKEEPRKLYSIMLSGIAPRPVAFVSSISADGVENLAPFSWFNQVTSSPPLVSFACSHNSGAAKDTVRNVRAGTGFTVNIISEPWIEQSNICSTDAPFEVNEWPISGLTKTPSILVKAPRVKESAFSMECELYQAIEIRDPKTEIITSTLVLGLVKFIHMRNDVIDPERGVADPGKLKPIARMGGLTYAKVSEGFTLPRKSWKEIGGEIREKLGDDIDGPSTITEVGKSADSEDLKSSF